MNPLTHCQTLGDLLHRSAARTPDKLAIVCGETRWTYAEFDHISERLAAGLAQRGIAKGINGTESSPKGAMLTHEASDRLMTELLS